MHSHSPLGQRDLVAAIGWLFMHDLEEKCDVRASNIESARAAACTREPTHRKRLAAGALNFLWEIVPLQTLMSTKLPSGRIGVFWNTNRPASKSAMRVLQPGWHL